MSNLKRIRSFLVRLVVATAVVSGVFVVTQDIQIFPGVLTTLMGAPGGPPPADIDQLYAKTADGETISIWRARAGGDRTKKLALLFHGNGELLPNFAHVQRWFRSLGYTNYALDYRGYGGSSGWPSEEGIYRDGEAAMELLLTEEQARPEEVLIFGGSIGTGPSAFVAQKYKVKTLFLASPYESINRVVEDLPFFGFLEPFLWYRFPTGEYLSKLEKTCVVVVHGRLDYTIPFRNSELLRGHFKGTGGYHFIDAPDAGHNDVLMITQTKAEEALELCSGNRPALHQTGMEPAFE